jgi:DNA-directed RNA polymerase alpha subunit
MPTLEKSLRTCSKGHRYYKSSDCPTCPVCEAEKKPESGFLSLISAPARRALQNEGIHTLQQLSKYSETELMALHGFGKTTLPKLENALHAKGLSFRKNKQDR